METFTPEQRQALQNAHQQVVQASAQQAQQAHQELTERVAALQSELDRARGARRTQAGMTGKLISLNRTGSNWEEFNLKLKAFVGLRSEPLVREMERMEEPNAVDPELKGVIVDLGTENRNPLLRLDDADDRHQLEAREGCRGQQRAGGLQAAVSPMALWYERPQLGEDAGDPAVELRDVRHRDLGQLGCMGVRD